MNDYFKWDDSLSVGIMEIDDQHKTLIGYINQLKSSLDNPDEKVKTLQEILAGLFNYTVYHFFSEEQIMESIDYPFYPKHKTEHIEFTSRVIKYIEMFTSGKDEIAEDVFDFLKKWLTGHIMNTDMALGDYLKTHKPNTEGVS
ncbi:MAG: bacteriohemerythrin [Thermodesulfovibrionales bacterium]